MDLEKQDSVMQSYRLKYKEEGYLHISNFFKDELIDQIRNEAKSIFKKQLLRHNLVQNDCSEVDFEAGLYQLFKSDLPTFINCGKQVQHLIGLHQLSLNDKLIEFIKQMGLEFPIISTRPVLFFNSKFLATKETFWKTPPHQDWKSIQGSINSVVLWIPLLDIDVKLGALEVIPKSHKLGLLYDETVDGFGMVTEEYRKDELYVPLEVSKGDIVLFSQFLIHRSGNNSTKSIRWSCHFRYNDLEEDTFIERGFPHNYNYGPKEDIIHPNFDTKKYTERYFNL